MSAERHAWQQLLNIGQLPPDALYSPSKGARGDYTRMLKSLSVLDKDKGQSGHNAPRRQGVVRHAAGRDPSADGGPVSPAGVGQGATLPTEQARKASTTKKVRRLDSFADELLTGSTPVSDRLIHLRQEASDLGLSLRDHDLQRKLWEARRRRSGAIEMLGPGMSATVEPETWAWEGVILAGDSNLLASDPKVGKTTLLIDAIARWHRGDSEHLGLAFCGPCPPVIIAGTDMPQSRWLRLLHRFGLAEPAGADRFQLLPDGPIRGLFSMDSPIHLDPEGIARLADLASKHPGCLLIVDSYAKLTNNLGLKESSSDFAGPLGDLQEAIAPYGTTLVVIHHSGRTRAGEGAVAASRGTTALPAAVSQCISLSWLNKGKGTTDKRVVLQTEGRGGEPLQLLIEQNLDGWQSHGDAAEVFRDQRIADAEDEMNDRQATALEEVRERWEMGRQRTTSSDLIGALQLRGRTAARIARRALNQLEKRGLVESSKETTPNGQVVWFWPAGGLDKGHPPVHPVPCVPSVLRVPSAPDQNPPSNAQTPYEIGEGTGRTHGIRGTEGIGSRSQGVPSLSVPFGDPIGSGADAFDEDDDPAWGPRPMAI